MHAYPNVLERWPARANARRGALHKALDTVTAKHVPYTCGHRGAIGSGWHIAEHLRVPERSFELRGVSGEDLVSSVTGERDLHVFASEPGHSVVGKTARSR